MKKNQIKELIGKIMALNIVGPDDYDDVGQALEYMDYYVKLGNDRAMFFEELGTILQTRQRGLDAGADETFVDFVGVNCMLALIKKFFDEEYFKDCMNVPQVTEDKALLKEYIYKLDKESLKGFLVALINGKHDKGLFLSAHSSTRMWFELNQKTIAVDSSVVDMSEPDYTQYSKADPLYMFKYLDTKTIAQVIYEHIDKDEEKAGELAQKIYMRDRKAPVHNNNKHYDKKMLREYLDKFNMAQLKDFFKLISYYRTDRGFFIAEDAWSKMMTGFNVVARKKNKDIPIWDDKNIFFKENETYFFDCLNKKRIADALYKYINDKVIMAENMAETLYHCGYEEAMQYPEMVLNLQMQFGPQYNILM